MSQTVYIITFGTLVIARLLYDSCSRNAKQEQLEIGPNVQRTMGGGVNKE